MKLKIGDIIRCERKKAYWKVVACKDEVNPHWKLHMFFTEDFCKCTRPIPGRLYNENMATIITLEWIQKQIEEAHDNYTSLWAAIEDEEYAKRS